MESFFSIRDNEEGMEMKLESILLGVLARHPRTGYDLKKYLDTQGRFLRSNTQMSQVYRSLARMEDNGWVVHTVEPRAGATDAKTYRITDEGMTVLLDWLTGPYLPPSRYNDPDLDARLAFAEFMTREQILRLIETELSTRHDEIARYRHRDRQLEVREGAESDPALVGLINEWMHRKGAAGMDQHVAALERLRAFLLDTPEDAEISDYLHIFDTLR
ncbi:PadR family transcriptional regulator [Nocardioides sp. NPDC051685]|uniref:PadR family transcriptional regulator n=1 Tax=Nocardioides sp. NPDC051685 TaxID=3364334 RepID=UPI0037A80B61